MFKAPFNKLFAASIITLITVLISETVLHIHFYYVKGYWLFSGHSNFSVYYAKPVTDRRKYALREHFKDEMHSINEFGFRGTPIVHPNDRPLICVLGDSVPYGAGVKDMETFPHHLQVMLRSIGSRSNVLNAGVPSYNLRQSLDRWRFDILPRWTCSLIIINAANDVSLIDHFGAEWTADRTWASQRFGIEVSRRSSLTYYGMSVLNRFRPRTLDTATEQKFLSTLRHELLIGINAIRANHIPIVLMPINPCYYTTVSLSHPRNKSACAGNKEFEIIGRKWDRLIVGVNEILKSFSVENRISYLDTIKEFDSRLVREGKYIDFIHFSDNGARDVAGLLLEHIMKYSLLDNPLVKNSNAVDLHGVSSDLK